MTFLTYEQQIARFGMTRDEGHALRDRVTAKLDAADLELAQAVWTKMREELPVEVGPHPEAVRLRMLQGLDKGFRPGEAAEAALRFARGEEA